MFDKLTNTTHKEARMRNITKQATLMLCAAAFVMIGCEAEDTTPDPGMTQDTTTMDAGPMGTAGADTLEAVLSGDAAAPDPGDPDGSGTATVALDPDDATACFEIEVENIAEPGAAHIHSGAAGASGPPILDFNVPENGLSGCVDADESTILAILGSPSEYYVNVHNEEFGAGAVRGQLGM